MKKLRNSFNSLLAAAALIIASALNVSGQKAEIGFRFMPTFTSFDAKSSSGGTIQGEVTLGYGIGALLGFNFSDHVGIQAEIIYNTISQKYSEQQKEYKINLKYINIPLLLSINTGKSKPINLNVVAGPQVGFNVGSKVSSTGESGTTQAVLSIKKSDVGVAYGGGLDFGLNTALTTRLSLGYRGVFGLIDISDDEKSISTESYYILDRTKLSTNSLYIGLSLLF